MKTKIIEPAKYTTIYYSNCKCSNCGCKFKVEGTYDEMMFTPMCPICNTSVFVSDGIFLHSKKVKRNSYSD